MGAADIVPGVSGGTVALVLGHYQRLVTAISQLDRIAVGHLRAGNWRLFWSHIDGRFLVALGGGIAAGILGLASLMHWLLEHRFSETMAVFFGLVLASGWVVARMVRRWNVVNGLAVVAAAAFAWLISSLTPTAGDPTIPYLFGCAIIAICAMILPGISGAFILLLLGAYHPVTEMIKEAARLNITLEMLLRLTVFGLGCVIGLMLFSRLLRYLLDHRASTTYAALLGLMLGSLRKLWPLQMPTPETAELAFKDRQWMMVAPNQWSGSLIVPIALVLVSALFVLGLHAFTVADRHPTDSPNPSDYSPSGDHAREAAKPSDLA
jgi:putative membrane protein